MAKYFDIIPADELRNLQHKSNVKRSENQDDRARVALGLYQRYKSLDKVMSVLKVKKRQAYNLVLRGEQLSGMKVLRVRRLRP